MADGRYRDDGQYFSADIDDAKTITPKVIIVGSDGAPSQQLVTGRATALSPTYLEAAAALLSLTLKGGLRAALIDAAGNELTYTGNTPVVDSLLPVNDLSTVLFSQNTAADHTAIAAVAAQTIRVHRIILSTGGAVNVTVKRGSTAISPLLKFPAATPQPWVLEFCPRAWWTTGINEALVLTLSAAVAVDAQIGYVVG